MSLPAKLKRYLLILERVRRRPSFAELHDHLSAHGFELSHRTLQRDLERLRIDLGIEVEYDRPNNVYRMAELDGEHDTVLRLLERAQLLELVGDDPKRARELAKHIDFEGLGRLQGLEHLSPLLRAIRERKEVVITYRRFQTDETKEHHVRPHILKEYHGRWYVVGWSRKYPRPITLGLDRIEGILITSARFALDKSRRLREVVASMIGVDASAERIETVLVRASADQAKYIRSLPWHASQQVEREDEEHVVFRFTLRPNYELRQLIMGCGAQVKVLEPAWLAKEIQQVHKDSVEMYRR
ncbi:MAG: WYL domain-containing protein [Flavobacteriales bacterium]|nr:WYL domain-containing protein [Flavobacteriales bacterium]